MPVPYFSLLLLVLLPGSLCHGSFVCPEEFGYYEHPSSCSKYYVCVFGGALLESCVGGLVYSNDLQTCDWPRNVACKQDNELLLEKALETEIKKESAASSPGSREPRLQHDSSSSSVGSNLVTPGDARPADKKNEDEEDEEELISLSPQPSIVNTVTHGAQKHRQGLGGKKEAVNRLTEKQVKHRQQSLGSAIFKQDPAPVFVPPRPVFIPQQQPPEPATRPPPRIETVFQPEPSPPNPVFRPPPPEPREPEPSAPNLVRNDPVATATGGGSSSSPLFRPRTPPTSPPPSPSTTIKQAENFRLKYGSRLQKEEPRSSHIEKIDNAVNEDHIEVLNTSQIQQNLLASIPGVLTALDDSQYFDNDEDEAFVDDFYYTEYNDPIYDQFQQFKDVDFDDGDSSRQDSSPGNIFLDFSNLPTRPKRHKTSGPNPGDSATRCSERTCQLPDCHCGGPEIPGNLSASRMPQLVVLTFDDSVNDLNKRLYQDIFHPGRKNPNGCPIAGTFYVSHEWTDYGLVQSLYADGHEIASHSISHSFGEQFSKKKWIKEMAGQREILAAFAGVHLEDVRGIRAPFLAIGGNNMFAMLHEANFTYDSSMPIYENKPPYFPYSLDYKIPHECMIPPCPNKAFPGVWEIPLVMWNDLKDGRCSMADACSNPSTAEGIYYMILKNFQRHYNTNKAPFGLFYHPAWFTHPHHKEGFELFLDTIVGMDDVWLVTSWQVLQWLRNPTPLEDINKFEPFKCNYQNRPPRCDKPVVCNLWHKSGVRYMRTCQTCPDKYPWTGRTGVANSLVDNL